MFLKSMIKEEWRIHSSLFGNFLFALFPFMLLLFSFLGSFFVPMFLFIVPAKTMVVLAHYIFLLFGVSVGGFGLFGREAMNRRFGQASLIAYSSRSLPVSEKTIFFYFFVKDVIFYFLLWIFPIIGGIFIANSFISLGINMPLMTLTLTHSFLIGLSVIFLLSTLYAHSNKTMVLFFVFVVLLGAEALTSNLVMALPSLSVFFYPNITNLSKSLFFIIVPSAVSLVFLKIDYPQRERHFKNSLGSLSKKIGGKYSQFVAKDFLDLKRSEGGLGKIIFSFLFPLMILWVILFVFLKFLPGSNILVLFAIFLGIISSSVYNWLTEFDLFSTYGFLPIKVSSVIKSKLISFLLINLISFVILFFVTITTAQYMFFLPAVQTFLTTSLYALSIIIYLTGLHPNKMLYNAKTFALYIFLIAPVLLVMIFVSVFNPFLLALSPVLMIPSLKIIEISFDKWNSRESQNF